MKIEVEEGGSPAFLLFVLGYKAAVASLAQLPTELTTWSSQVLKPFRVPGTICLHLDHASILARDGHAELGTYLSTSSDTEEGASVVYAYNNLQGRPVLVPAKIHSTDQGPRNGQQDENRRQTLTVV